MLYLCCQLNCVEAAGQSNTTLTLGYANIATDQGSPWKSPSTWLALSYRKTEKGESDPPLIAKISDDWSSYEWKNWWNNQGKVFFSKRAPATLQGTPSRLHIEILTGISGTICHAMSKIRLWWRVGVQSELTHCVYKSFLGIICL